MRRIQRIVWTNTGKSIDEITSQLGEISEGFHMNKMVISRRVSWPAAIEDRCM